MHQADYQFCPQCAQPLITKEISNLPRPFCPNCRFTYWGDFSIGVGGILWRENKVLLVRRAHNPGKGMWTIPGGYVDQGEKIEDAVVRELFEETGVNCEPHSLLAIRDRPGERHDIYIIFLLTDLGNPPCGDEDEVSEVGFYTWEQCQTMGLAGLTRSAIESSISAQTGFHKVENVDLIGHLSTLYSKR